MMKMGRAPVAWPTMRTTSWRMSPSGTTLRSHSPCTARRYSVHRCIQQKIWPCPVGRMTERSCGTRPPGRESLKLPDIPIRSSLVSSATMAFTWQLGILRGRFRSSRSPRSTKRFGSLRWATCAG
uniref:(northern house mosquito) hypothetical protein n=1 Tax=Culex pipiens TaxID=7175 RepID=A0A8D8GJF6_CULPI